MIRTHREDRWFAHTKFVASLAPLARLEGACPAISLVARFRLLHLNSVNGGTRHRLSIITERADWPWTGCSSPGHLKVVALSPKRQVPWWYDGQIQLKFGSSESRYWHCRQEVLPLTAVTVLMLIALNDNWTIQLQPPIPVWHLRLRPLICRKSPPHWWHDHRSTEPRV